MASDIVVPFLGALQASIAVLLTIGVGVIASQFQLISEKSSKEISKAAVRLFLPALLIVNVGEQLHASTALRYVPILIWSIIYQVGSLLLGWGLTKAVKLPSWVTPALAFNNTTSLPLLLIQSLDAAGILTSLDSSSDVIGRAKSYFLVNAMISNSLTFAIGPKFLDCSEDIEASESKEDKNDYQSEDERLENQEQEAERENEETSLLPNRAARGATRASYDTYNTSAAYFHRLPTFIQTTVFALWEFVNPPMIGAALGALIGLVPALHRLFFSTQQEGGYLNAWLTSALQNVGDLFAALQVIVVGIKLSASMLKWKKGESSGSMPWLPFCIVVLVRFAVWPAISIGVVYGLVLKGSVLSDDPILWFAMMLMPTGPPALSLTAMADVNGATEDEKFTIAKFLTVCYAVSPLICFSVVGALKASQAAVAA